MIHKCIWGMTAHQVSVNRFLILKLIYIILGLKGDKGFERIFANKDHHQPLTVLLYDYEHKLVCQTIWSSLICIWKHDCFLDWCMAISTPVPDSNSITLYVSSLVLEYPRCNTFPYHQIHLCLWDFSSKKQKKNKPKQTRYLAIENCSSL